jgi:catechol 2,3-dioxygenase-like lactoylglutathione lyase family enzyme
MIDAAPRGRQWEVTLVAALFALATVVLGIIPQPLFELVRDAGASVRLAVLVAGSACAASANGQRRIVVDDLPAAIVFFRELGSSSRAGHGRRRVGRARDRLADQRVEIAMLRTPDGHSRVELSRFLTPPVVADHRTAPVNSLGYLRVMFAVDDIDETLARLLAHGAQLVMPRWSATRRYRLCYIRDREDSSSGWPRSSASHTGRRVSRPEPA